MRIKSRFVYHCFESFYDDNRAQMLGGKAIFWVYWAIRMQGRIKETKALTKGNKKDIFFLLGLIEEATLKPK